MTVEAFAEGGTTSLARKRYKRLVMSLLEKINLVEGK